MGDARRNPASEQYRGPLPEFLVDGRVTCHLVPSQSWIEANKDNPDAQPERDDLRVQFVLVGRVTWPSALDRDTRRWPFVEIPIAEMSSMNLAIVLAHAKEARAQKYGSAPDITSEVVEAAKEIAAPNFDDPAISG